MGHEEVGIRLETYRVLSQEDVVAVRVWLQGGWNCAAAPQHSTKME